METEKSLFKNYLYNLSYQILTIFLPLITVPYVSRVLKPEGIGLNSYSFAVVSYVIMLGSLGFALHGNKIISTSRNDKDALKKHFWEIFIFRFLVMIVALVFYVFLFVLEGSSNNALYLVQGLGIVAALFDITWFLNGLEEFKKTVFRNFVVKIISLILIFIWVRTPHDLFKYVLIIQGSTLVGNLILFPYLRKYNIFSGLNISYFLSLQFSHHIKPTLQLFIPLASIQIYTVLNKIMLGYFTNSTEVGFYDNAMKIVTLVLTILTSFGTVIFPRSSYYFSIGNVDKVKYQFNLSIKITILIAFGFFVGLVGISKNFVIWFFGPGYGDVATVLPILAFSFIPISLASIMMTQYLVPSGKYRAYTFSVISGALINILLNIILIPRFNLKGAAISYILSESIVTLIQLFNSLKILSLGDNFKNIVTSAISAFLMIVILIIEQHVFSFLLPITLNLIQVVSGIISYILVLCLFKNESLKYILSIITSQLRKKFKRITI
jgi:O-antigen/teichoic acid export membrane protein